VDLNGAFGWTTPWWRQCSNSGSTPLTSTRQDAVPAKYRSAPGPLPSGTHTCSSTMSRRKIPKSSALMTSLDETESALEERHGPALD